MRPRPQRRGEGWARLGLLTVSPRPLGRGSGLAIF